MSRRTPKKTRKIKDYLLPHQGNGYKPIFLTVGGVAAALLLIVLIEGAYIIGTKFAFSGSNFMASVLPSVLIGYTNEDRNAAGLSSLESDALLAKAAQLKADDMAAKGYFAHISPEGKTPWYWLDEVKYQYSYAGENLAVDFVDSKDVENAWMASPAHHANIVKEKYTRIGIGTAQGMYQGRETTFVVQFFATPKKVPTAVAEVKKVAVSKNPRVLGAEVEPVATSAPVSAESQVTFPETIPNIQPLAQVVASPTHTVTYILAAVATFFLILLLIAIVVHIRIQFIEVIVGGLLVVLASLSVISFNAINGGAQVPVAPEGAASTQAL